VIDHLRIPRRPKWQGLEKSELQKQENLAFLAWRKSLAILEEGNSELTFTPFEKNIEVWKQLWRVVDMSDLLVQIVDGRDPLFYYCPDVASYVKEVNPNKGNFIIINKSDFLSSDIR